MSFGSAYICSFYLRHCPSEEDGSWWVDAHRGPQTSKLILSVKTGSYSSFWIILTTFLFVVLLWHLLCRWPLDPLDSSTKDKARANRAVTRRILGVWFPESRVGWRPPFSKIAVADRRYLKLRTFGVGVQFLVGRHLQMIWLFKLHLPGGASTTFQLSVLFFD